jgi:hypothetical protein
MLRLKYNTAQNAVKQKDLTAFFDSSIEIARAM